MLDTGETAEARIADLDVTNSSFCTVSNQRAIVVDGADGRREDQVCFSEKDILEVVVIHEGRVFLINFWSSGVASATDKATFDHFLGSFRFVETAEFTSARYGFTFTVPADLVAEPATTDWQPGTTVSTSSSYLDRFIGAGGEGDFANGFLGIASQPLPAGVSAEDWMTGHAERNLAAFGVACGGRVEDWLPTTVSGVAGRRVEVTCLGGAVTEVMFTNEGRGWVVTGDTALVDFVLDSFQLPG